MPRLMFDQTVSPTLLRRFELEGQYEEGDGRHYACILRENNDLIAHHPYSPSIEAHQMLWARDMLVRLNKELHHDGAWVACFTHPSRLTEPEVMADGGHREYRRVCLLWLDKDGDVQFTWDWLADHIADVRDFATLMLHGPHWVMQQLEEAHRLWSIAQETLDLQEGQTFKRAQGERAPSTRH
jgi:hypothetical protein